LPGKNGLQLTREIKANHPDIRIVILTGLGRHYKKAALKSGADGFFEKGRFSLEEIFATFDPSLPSEV
jgi:DNA-binding NarL/FixJ family response regulator